MTHFAFEAIGTHWEIDIYQDLDEQTYRALSVAIKDRIARYDKDYSRFRDDSLVTAMSREVGTYTLPDDALPLFALYRDLYDKTSGLFTPLVGNLISDAGYDAQYSLIQHRELTSPPKWDEAIVYSHPHITIKQPVLIDIGAAGKGYLIDIVAEIIASFGIPGYCIDAGGDMLHSGDEPLRIGLENPFNTKEVIGVYMLANKSLCGSAGTRRAWGSFTHIFNPHTRTSATDVVAVWVIADTALVADALATCLFLVEPEVLVGCIFDYVLVRSDGSYSMSPGCTAEIFAR